MRPQEQFCHNLACSARGLVGAGNIRVHSQTEQRYRCWTCKKTFAATTGTPFFRSQFTIDIVTLVLTLLVWGCPVQAIVAGFGLDARTVTAWLKKAGTHSQHVHEQVVQAGHVTAQHVQADEVWVKLVGRKVWMAMAMAVESRLWLGGEVSGTRDRALIKRLVGRVRACLKSLAVVVCVDGLVSYATAFPAGFRHRVLTGKRGRPSLVEEPGLLLGQMVKQYAKGHVTGIVRRVVRGKEATIQQVLRVTHTGTHIHTAYIERLNATFRSHLAILVRRGRALAHQDATVVAGMYLVGGVYNFCWHHQSLRVQSWYDFTLVMRDRTPAMAAGLTDHRWTVREFLQYQVPIPPWVAPTRRGRPPKP